MTSCNAMHLRQHWFRPLPEPLLPFCKLDQRNSFQWQSKCLGNVTSELCYLAKSGQRSRLPLSHRPSHLTGYCTRHSILNVPYTTEGWDASFISIIPTGEKRTRSLFTFKLWIKNSRACHVISQLLIIPIFGVWYDCIMCTLKYITPNTFKLF